MHRPPVNVDRWRSVLANALSFLAGVVDALGFLALGGFFVSFMTGNTTRMAVGLANHRFGEAAFGGLIILVFLAGAMAGFAVARAGAGRAKEAIAILLAALLFVAASVHALGFDHAACVLAAAPMGVENAIFQSRTGKSTGLTYMTGALVKTASQLVEALAGGRRWAWLEPFTLWLGLAAGAAVGATAYHAFGLDTLWAAGIAALILALGLSRLPDEA